MLTILFNIEAMLQKIRVFPFSILYCRKGTLNENISEASILYGVMSFIMQLEMESEGGEVLASCIISGNCASSCIVCD